jgi:hypothetical protein
METLAMRVKAVKLLILGCLSVFAMASWSQEKEASTKSASKSGGDKKQTKIDFEDELVEGELKKPELFYLLQKKQFNYKRLIKLRENFMPEMRRDGDELGRGRGKN